MVLRLRIRPRAAEVEEPGTDTLLATLTFPEESGSTQASGWVSLPFGVLLPEGELADADWPQFKLASDGTVCPATIYARRSHPSDSSWWHFGAFIRVPASVTGSGSIDIEVWSGGSEPSASSYTSADVSDMGDAGVSLTGETSGNLDGTWLSSVQQGVTDNDHVITFADGDAGAIFGIGQGFMNSGADHGQVEVLHWVQIIKGASGKKGYRYLGDVRQIFCDVSSPTPTKRVFSGFAYDDTTSNKIRDFDGHNTDGTTSSSVIGLTHYSGFFTCGTSGRWDWIQGDGSDAADCTMGLPQFDQGFFRASKLIPPWRLDITPTGGTTVYDYKPMGRGPISAYSMVDQEANLFEVWCARHFMRQNANDERTVRIGGLSQSHWRTRLRRSSTKTIVGANTDTSGTAKSYTGMGTNQPTWRYFIGSTIVGFQAPTSNTSLWTDDTTTAHRPNPAYYAWLVTAEPQFLDLVTDLAGQALVAQGAGAVDLDTPPYVTNAFQGAGTSSRDINLGGSRYSPVIWIDGTNLARIAAWKARDVVCAYLAQPDTAPDGVDVKSYFDDVIDTGCDFANAYNAGRSATWQASGGFSFRSAPVDVGYSMSNLYTSVAFCAAATGKTNAATFRNHVAKYYPAIVASGCDIAAVNGFNINFYDENDTQKEDAADWLFQLSGGQITSDATANTFSVGSGGSGNMNFTPTNGDMFAFGNGATKPFTEAEDWKAFVVINVSGQSFQLADPAAPSTPIDVTTAITSTSVYARVADFSPLVTFQAGTISSESYFNKSKAAMRILKAAGATGLDSVISTVDGRATDSAIGLAGDPTLAYDTTYEAA